LNEDENMLIGLIKELDWNQLFKYFLIKTHQSLLEDTSKFIGSVEFMEAVFYSKLQTVGYFELLNQTISREASSGNLNLGKLKSDVNEQAKLAMIKLKLMNLLYPQIIELPVVVAEVRKEENKNAGSEIHNSNEEKDKIPRQEQKSD